MFLLAAAPPQVDLRYARGPGAQQCPDDAAVRAAVAKRLGYRPWQPGAQRTVEAHIQRQQEGLQATVVMVERSGQMLGSRTLHSPTGDCVELTARMTLAISIAIDPRVMFRPVPLPPPPEQEPQSIAARTQPAPPRTIPQLRTLPHVPYPFRSFGHVLVHTVVGAAPLPQPGLTVGGGLGWHGYSLVVEARADLPAYLVLPEGAVSITRIHAAVLPCAAAWVVEVCGVGALGAQLVAASRDLGVGTGVLPWAAVGGRAALRWGPTPWLKLVAAADPELNLIQLNLTDTRSGARLWRAWPVGVTFRLGAELSFP